MTSVRPLIYTQVNERDRMIFADFSVYSEPISLQFYKVHFSVMKF